MVTPENHNIAMVADSGSFMVAPRQISAYVEDSITFNNLCKEDAVIIFPEEHVFGKTRIEVPAGGNTTETIPADFADFGNYQYAVYYPARREFAHASMPIIIIYPRRD